MDQQHGRQAYITELEGRLAVCDAHIRKLRERGGNESRLEELLAKRQKAIAKLDQIRQSDDDGWDIHKLDAGKIWDDFVMTVAHATA